MLRRAASDQYTRQKLQSFKANNMLSCSISDINKKPVSFHQNLPFLVFIHNIQNIYTLVRFKVKLK